MKYHVLLFSLIQIPNVTCCHPCSLSPSNCTPFLGRLAANTVTEKLIISFSFSFYFPSSAIFRLPTFSQRKVLLINFLSSCLSPLYIFTTRQLRSKIPDWEIQKRISNYFFYLVHILREPLHFGHFEAKSFLSGCFFIRDLLLQGKSCLFTISSLHV